MKKQIALFIIASSLIISSCSNAETKKEELKTATTTNTEEVKTETPKGKYSLKSAIIEMKSMVMGLEQKQVIMFDDYGAKEVTEVTASLFGQKSHNITINKEGFVWNIDMVKKTGTKIKIPKEASINFNDLGSAIAKDMNLKKVSNETFLGKSCDKFTIDYKKQQMKGYYLVWNGIPMKTEISIMGMKTLVEATKISENATIDTKKFEIPEGVKIAK